jgi:hypothetical protein
LIPLLLLLLKKPRSDNSAGEGEENKGEGTGETLASLGTEQVEAGGNPQETGGSVGAQEEKKAPVREVQEEERAVALKNDECSARVFSGAYYRPLYWDCGGQAGQNSDPRRAQQFVVYSVLLLDSFWRLIFTCIPIAHCAPNLDNRPDKVRN